MTTATTAPTFSGYAYGCSEAHTALYTIYASKFSWAIVQNNPHRTVAEFRAPDNAYADLKGMQAAALAALAAL